MIWQNFCEKIVAVKFCNFHSVTLTLWSLLDFCITWKLFREINYFVNCLLRKLFSRKFFKKSWYKNMINSTVCTLWISFNNTKQSYFFDKNSVKIKSNSKSISRNFWWEWIFVLSTVWWIQFKQAIEGDTTKYWYALK